MEITKLLLILFVGCQAHSVIGSLYPVNGTDSPSDTARLEADQFLTSYGYYPSSGLLPAQVRNPSLRKHSDAERTKALKLFQKFYNLHQSGELDKETTKLMKSPRCGNADLNTMGAPVDFEVEEEENFSEAIKDHENQDTEKSGVNVDREKRSLKMSGQRNRGMLRRWRSYENTMIWEVTHPSKQKHLQPLSVQRRLVRSALSIWSPHLAFDYRMRNRKSNRWFMKAHMEIKFHSFAASSWNDKMHLGRAWRINKGNKNTRPKNASKRKGSHAHVMVPLDEPKSNRRDIHLDEDYDWSNHEELLSVLIHEIGHACGLGHSSDVTSVMYPYTRNVTELGWTDIINMRRIYHKQGVGLPYTPGLCDAVFREVDNFVWIIGYPTIITPSWIRLFFIFYGKKLVVRQWLGEYSKMYDRYDEFFIDAPSKYDVAFSDSRRARVFFVAGNKVYQYRIYRSLKPTKPLIHRDVYFPETPKTVLVVENDQHSKNHTFNVMFYGAENYWNFSMRRGKIQNTTVQPIPHKWVSEDTKFGVHWVDGDVYIFKRNGSWIYYDPEEEKPSELMTDKMYWLQELLCGNHATSTGMSPPSLVLAIMLILIELY